MPPRPPAWQGPRKRNRKGRPEAVARPPPAGAGERQSLREIEHALDRAVFAHRSVEQGEYDRDLLGGGCVGEHRGRRHVGADGIQPTGDGVWTLDQRVDGLVGERHCPAVEMPTGVIRYRSGSAARSTWAAVVHDTSCSADSPPNSTTR